MKVDILTIGNSVSKIDGLTVDEHRRLKNLLSYETDPQARFYSGFHTPSKISLLGKDGSFPTGLLYLVEDFLIDSGIKHTIVDTRVEPQELPQDQSFTFNSTYLPYPEQVAAVEAASAFKRGIITAPTGVGKSMIAALLIYAIQVKTLLVVPSLELKRQLTESLTRIFGEDKVGKNKSIYVENIDSVDAKTMKIQYNMLIIDEFHHSGAKSYRMKDKKLWNGIYYKFGLTATPFRSQDRERILLESVLSKVIYQLPYDLAVQKGYIVPMEVYYISIPHLGKTESFSTYNQAYKALIVGNKERNNYVKEVIEATQNDKALYLVKEIAHGNLLYKSSGVLFANGIEEDTPLYISAFNNTPTGSLIGTMGVMGEGIDTKPCKFVVLVSPMKSKNQFMQCVGRAFRRSPGKQCAKIILFKDNSHKWFTTAFGQQIKYLREEYNIEPIEITIDDLASLTL